MDKELIDRAWRVLPAEFRESVKSDYLYLLSGKCREDLFSLGMMAKLQHLFGIHNLTSDAEGEEMLTCVKDQAVKLYDIADRAFAINGDKWYQGYMKAMQDLFGSKCLPDKEPQPAEPKYHKGEKVCYNGYV